jgi:hypothetical protein
MKNLILVVAIITGFAFTSQTKAQEIKASSQELIKDKNDIHKDAQEIKVSKQDIEKMIQNDKNNKQNELKTNIDVRMGQEDPNKGATIMQQYIQDLKKAEEKYKLDKSKGNQEAMKKDLEQINILKSKLNQSSKTVNKNNPAVKKDEPGKK